MPDTIPETVPQPPVQFSEFDLNACHAESIDPALLYFVDFLDAFIETHRSGFPGDGLQLLL